MARAPEVIHIAKISSCSHFYVSAGAKAETTGSAEAQV